MIKAILDNPLATALALLAGSAIVAVGTRLGQHWANAAEAIIGWAWKRRLRYVRCHAGAGESSHPNHRYWHWGRPDWSACPIRRREHKDYLNRIGFTGKGRAS